MRPKRSQQPNATLRAMPLVSMKPASFFLPIMPFVPPLLKKHYDTEGPFNHHVGSVLLVVVYNP
jgi:hypothetical protein